jgi:hypothetical protein
MRGEMLGDEGVISLIPIVQEEVRGSERTKQKPSRKQKDE